MFEDYNIFLLALYLIVCFFIGSIPFAYILVRLIKGVDIRQVGSGNPGATNAGRVLGKYGFVAAFLLDFLKGFLPLYFFMNVHTIPNSETFFIPLVAVALVLGHTYSVFLQFKGGKGVATAAGVFCMLTPYAALVAFISFAVVFLATRMVSAGSIAASVGLFIASMLTTDVTSFKMLTAVVALFVIVKHKSNIVRIMNGVENKVEFKKKG